MLRVLKGILHLFYKLLSHKKKKQFFANAECGANFEVGPYASCINKTGSRLNINIADNVTIMGRIECDKTGYISIGDYTNIRYNSSIGSTEHIHIGKYVIISHDVFIYDNNNHPVSPKERMELSASRFDELHNSWQCSASRPVVIEDHVWIGFGAVVLKGVTIGRGSIVAAKAVVTKDIPPFSVAAGNPAIVVKTIQDDLPQRITGPADECASSMECLGTARAIIKTERY